MNHANGSPQANGARVARLMQPTPALRWLLRPERDAAGNLVPPQGDPPQPVFDWVLQQLYIEYSQLTRQPIGEEWVDVPAIEERAQPVPPTSGLVLPGGGA